MGKKSHRRRARERERKREEEIVVQSDPEEMVNQPIQPEPEEIVGYIQGPYIQPHREEIFSDQPDPDEKAMFKCLNWTPLHVAASRGRLEESHINLLKGNPALAEALDSEQRSLLHLASANGHTNVVTQLLEVRPEMCLARDRDGRNPIHIAAMRGNFDVFTELYKANHHAARARLNTRETILHLCVKYDQPRILKPLLQIYIKGKELVDAVDNDGNTILHLAVANRNFQIVNCILNYTSININKINEDKQTAMDVLLLRDRSRSRLDGEDRAIHDLLKSFGGKKNSQILFDPARDSDRRNGIMVSAALFATLAFQVGAAPPGGVWQDDSNGHKSGKAVMASHYPTLYQVFLCLNVVGFTSSFLTIILMWLNLLYKVLAYIHLVSVTMGISILLIAATYGISLFMVSPEKQLGKVNLLVEIFIPFILTVALFPLVNWVVTVRCWERKRVTNRTGDEEYPDEPEAVGDRCPSWLEVEAGPADGSRINPAVMRSNAAIKERVVGGGRELEILIERPNQIAECSQMIASQITERCQILTSQIAERSQNITSQIAEMVTSQIAERSRIVTNQIGERCQMERSGTVVDQA